MRENDQQQIRAGGPAIVRAGPADGPAVLVLDPAGDAKHDELPATWRPFTDHLRVVWWRLPAANLDGVSSDAVLSDVACLGRTVDVVGYGTAAQLGLTLGVRYPVLVRSVVLVDPDEPDADPATTHHERGIDWCEQRFGLLTGRLAEQGTPVEVIISEADDRAEQELLPLPIGHPKVVTTVVQALVDVAAEQSALLPSQDGAHPEPSDLLDGSWTAVRNLVADQ